MAKFLEDSKRYKGFKTEVDKISEHFNDSSSRKNPTPLKQRR
jgi:hypothetical protein